MALTTDEQAMRNALLDLAGGQPDAPVDRLDGVSRRHRRRRTAQSVGAAIAVAALAIGGVSVASGVRTTNHHPTTVATNPAPKYWQLAWAERNDGTVNKERVLFWLGQQGYEGLHDVRWLYAATAPNTIDKWAILEASYGASPGNPAAKALITAVSHDGGDKWTAQTHSAPLVSTDVIGVADHGGTAVLALAAPTVNEVELVKVVSAGIETETFPRPVNGAAMLTNSSAWKPGSTLVRVPGAPSTSLVLFDNDEQSIGQPAWWKTAPVRPHGDVPVGSSFGGGGGGFGNIIPPRAGTVVLQVRCVGPAPMRLVLTTADTSQDLDVDRCDGVFHTYLGPQVTSGDRIGVENKGSQDRFGDQGDNVAVIDVSLRP